MNWTELKNSIYYVDGSWRDIYVKDTTIEDWQKWVKHVNSNFRLTWFNGKTKKIQSQIDFDMIKEYWSGGHEVISPAEIFLGEIKIKVHFFDHDEFENDFDPRTIKSVEDHQVLISFLKAVSKALAKPVILTPENGQQHVLIHVNSDEVTMQFL